MSIFHFPQNYCHVLFSSIKVHFLRIIGMGKACIPGLMDPNTQESFIWTEKKDMEYKFSQTDQLLRWIIHSSLTIILFSSHNTKWNQISFTHLQGLYHADERFGPGVMTYPDGRQDVGLWHRERLLRLCTTLESGFSLEDFPEHMRRLPRNHLKQPQLLLDVESSRETDQGLSEDKDRFILPPDIESYSTDSDHLPIPRCLRRELDLHFFGTSDVSKEQQSPSTALPLQQRMNAHIQRHR